MTSPRPRPEILEISPYVGGEATLAGVNRVHKLSSNEGAFGVPPGAQEAFRRLAGELFRYPDGGALDLRRAIGARFGLDPARIVCGAGSDDLIYQLAAAYGGPGRDILMTEHGFSIYHIAGTSAGSRVIKTKERNLTADVDALLAAVSPATRLCFLANPNNPTGTYISFDEVKRLHRSLPQQTLLVLDAAYAEYVRRNDYESGIELVATSENVVMTRTFSKIHGLAALRLGWIFGPAHVIAAINRIRGPFNVNAPAIAAGIAAIEDHAHQERSREHNTRWLGWLTQEIEKLGLKVTPSVANFLLIHFPETKSRTAKEANAFLTARGLVLRQLGAYKLPNALRMSVGTEEANRLVVAALKEFLAGTA